MTQSGIYLQALARLEPMGFEFNGILSNHGPMAVDALVELGAEQRVESWLDRYVGHLEPYPAGVEPVVDVESSWRNALGQSTRAADWAAYFEDAISRSGWQEVLASWWPRLMPGIGAAAFHGVLRTAHAARALQRSETDSEVIRRELARGLAHWAGRYRELPVDVPTFDGNRDLGRAATLAADLTGAQQSSEPGIMSTLALADRLDGLQEILGSIRRYDDHEVHDAISDLTSSGAHIIAQRAGPAIPLVHAVTGPAAVRLLLPVVPVDLWVTTLGYVAQFSLTLLAVYTEELIDPPAELDDPPPAIIDRVVRHGDEHVIKFAEACLREYRLEPDPAYLLAIRAVENRITSPSDHS